MSLYKIAKKADGEYSVNGSKDHINTHSLKDFLKFEANITGPSLEAALATLHSQKELEVTSAPMDKGVIVDIYEVNYPTPADPMKQTQELARHLDEQDDFVTQQLFPGSTIEEISVDLIENLQPQKRESSQDWRALVENEAKKFLENTVFKDYDTVIFDLDGTVWDCYAANGDGMGAYSTDAPYALQMAGTVLDINGNTIRLQSGIIRLLSLLYKADIRLGVMSSGEREYTTTQSQPSMMLLKKFGIYKYFDESIILKRLDLSDSTKGDYVKPNGKTLFIDDDPQNIEDVNSKDLVDVLPRQAFTQWSDLVNNFEGLDL